MNVPFPSGPLRYALTVLPFFLCQILLSPSTKAQGGASESISTRRSNGHVVVYVRDPGGRPLTISASVRLYSPEGTPVGQASTGTAGQVTFTNVQPGGYSIEVEAPGYVKAHADTGLPVGGEAQVEIELRPETNTSSATVPAGAAAILAPDPKKELDAGLEALRRKDLNEAQKHLEKAGQLAPSHPDVLYLLGTLYAQMKDLPRAEGLLAKTIQMYPEHARAQAALGIVLANETKYDTAVPALQKALELNGESWEARWALARCYYHQRNFEPALEQSRQALHDSNGKAPQIALVTAAALTAVGQYDESAAILREFVDRHSDLPEAARARRWLERLQQMGKIKQN